MAGLADIPDAQLLDAAFLPASPGLEPLVAFHPPRGVDLPPGAWRRAVDALLLPDAARHLHLPLMLEDGSVRYVETRALAVPDALEYLTSLDVPDVRPSVRAWQLAAHVARRLHEGAMRPRGEAATDAALGKFEAAFPPASHALVADMLEGTDPLVVSDATDDEVQWLTLDAHTALHGFLDAALQSYALGLHLRTAQAKPKRRAPGVQLTLRVVEPTRRDDTWHVHKLVPSVADNGDPVVGTSAAADEVLARAFDVAPLLRDLLGVATRQIEAEQVGALIVAAADLSERGVRLELPERLTAGVSAHVRARVRIRGASSAPGRGASTRARLRFDDLVGYDLTVALGDTDIDAEKLRALARDARGMVKVGEGWMALTDTTRDELEGLARAVEARDAVLASGSALAAALSGSLQLPGGVEAEVERVDHDQLGRAIEYLRAPEKFGDVVPGEQFTGSLRPYQQAGLGWLAGLHDIGVGGVLADDMGLGKTVQVIALLTRLVETVAVDADGATPAEEEQEPAPQLHAIIVCPTSLIGNWERELSRFAPQLSVHVHHGPQRIARPSALPAGTQVIVTSYGLVSRDRTLFEALPCELAIFDEAQAVKNPDTEQARGVRRIRARQRFALTGTPMENRLLELWAIFDLVNPGLLGRAATFQRVFARPIERTGDEQAVARLRRITAPFMLRRVKTDPTIVPDLPEKQEQSVICTLTPEQATLYQAVVDQAMTDVATRDGIGRRGAVLALLTKLKQVCNHPAQALGEKTTDLGGRSGKLERLQSMLEEVVAEGDRALVFTQYAQMGGLLHGYLPELLGCEVQYLHGGVPRPQREKMIARFQEDGDEPIVFVLSLKTGGLGLNLMQAAHVFHYDRWWNPAVEDQATDRTHRIGQQRAIQVHKLVCAGTLEERIAAIIDDKRKLAGRVIDAGSGGDGWLTELDDDELRTLVQLDDVYVPEVAPSNAG